MYTLSNYRFVNWARNVRSKPHTYFLPDSTDDIQAIVKLALAENRKVRVVGAGHSWSAAAATDVFMVSLDKLNRLVHVDKETLQVTVQGGIRLKHLHRLLYPQGLAMQNIGSISEQSIAGAISTGTHGTGLGYGVLASQVLALKLVNGLGDIVELKATDADFKAAAVSLGCMGIITEVTIQCVDLYHVEEKAEPVLFEDMVANLLTWAKAEEHPKVWWFPHTRHAMMYSYTKVSDDIRDTFAKQYIDDGVVSKLFFRGFLSMGHISHGFRPAVNTVISKIFLKKISRVNVNYKVLNVPMPPRHREAEYAFPLDKAPEVLTRLHLLINTQKLKMNFVLEVRFTKTDDFLLSACNRQDTCYIGFYYAGEKNWERYLKLFEELAMEYGARPHLGKEFTVESSYLHTVMPGIKQFDAVRKTYDPHGVFENKFTQKLFEE
jgi:sugar-1,4-lactone oxidase-like protein